MNLSCFKKKLTFVFKKLHQRDRALLMTKSMRLYFKVEKCDLSDISFSNCAIFFGTVLVLHLLRFSAWLPVAFLNAIKRISSGFSHRVMRVNTSLVLHKFLEKKKCGKFVDNFNYSQITLCSVTVCRAKCCFPVRPSGKKTA